MLLTNASVRERIPTISEENVIGEVIHYKDENHCEKAFHKTALAWANENNDPPTATDLLHHEHRTHQDEDDGISCIRGQLANDNLTFFIVRTYSKFYPTESNCKRFTKAFMTTFFILLLAYSLGNRFVKKEFS